MEKLLVCVSQSIIRIRIFTTSSKAATLTTFPTSEAVACE